MKVVVGSRNPQKVDAVQEAFEAQGLEVIMQNYAVSSGVPDQPKGRDEVILGAKNRATEAYKHALGNGGVDYSIGIESGLVEDAEHHSGWMNSCVCVIYDGNNFYHAWTAAFALPDEVAHYVNEGMEVNKAVHAAGLTTKTDVGSEEGIVGILTKGAMTRRDYTRQAVHFAISRLGL